jgi:hypothetical protein
MKSIAVAASVAALLAVFATPVSAQTQKEKPAAVGAAPQQTEVKPAVRKVRRSRKDVDARHCLQLATNIEIHRCALKYR